MSGRLFQDRIEAGRALATAAERLVAEHPEMTDPVILALPRGGVPVALEVARALDAPLDLLMVRKIGVPFQPELAAAAVVDGADPQMVVNEDVLRMTGLTVETLEPVKRRELAEIERRRKIYLKDRAPEPVRDRDAIVVDDGVATGATTRAALKALRLKRPRSLTLAIPVAPPDTAEALRREVDHLICLETPRQFYAIGAHYLSFSQVSDEEVVRLLDAAPRPTPRGEG